MEPDNDEIAFQAAQTNLQTARTALRDARRRRVCMLVGEASALMAGSMPFNSDRALAIVDEILALFGET